MDRADVVPISFEMLGPVEIMVNGQALAVRPTKLRYLVAMLLLHANRTVPAGRLAEALWNAEPPSSAQKNLHQYVYRLRALLAEHGVTDRVVSRPAGYLLRVHPGELDLDRFEALAAMGRQARDVGDLRAAARFWAKALQLWQGEPLVDVRGSLLLDEVAAPLAERRLWLMEERIAVELRLGRCGELVPELEPLVARYPLRERLWEYLMLALYGAGRKADALDAYRASRLLLVRELGIEPGPAMRELQSAILADDVAALAARLGSTNGGRSRLVPAARRRNVRLLRHPVGASPDRPSRPRPSGLDDAAVIGAERLQ